MARNCAEVPGVFVDEATCRSACPSFSSAGQANDFDGDTVQCRITHLTLAGNPLPGQDRLHCPHGAVNAAAPCTGPPPGAD